MKKILTIIGARPQIIKASALSRVIRDSFSDKVKEVIVHTGQHYDENMSGQFFEELQIPQPDYNLHVGSGKHGFQTAKMIAGIEEILEKEEPDYLIIYGDTNSTLASAIAASKIYVPIVHIEAGLRSFNKKMPEEINRIISDHVSTYLFPPTQAGISNLEREGFDTTALPPYSMDHPGIFNVGDVMYDNSLHFSKVADGKVNLEKSFGVRPENYLLATLHRNHNTDDPHRLRNILEAYNKISLLNSIPILIPLHPRTKKQMEALLDSYFYEQLNSNPYLIFIPPVSFLEMVALEKGAKAVMTDSGGVQKEAYFFGKPCIILRAETEWVEIVESGMAILCDADTDRILKAYEVLCTSKQSEFLPLYGEGDAAEKIVKILLGEGKEF